MKGSFFALLVAASFAAALSTACSSASQGPGASDGCNKSTGSGTSEECTWNNSTTPDFACASGTAVGSCTSSGLIGCCETQGSCGGGDYCGNYLCSSATCYYSASAASSAQSSCTGQGQSWVTVAP
jgi:hypothetical protein